MFWALFWINIEDLHNMVIHQNALSTRRVAIDRRKNASFSLTAWFVTRKYRRSVIAPPFYRFSPHFDHFLTPNIRRTFRAKLAALIY